MINENVNLVDLLMRCGKQFPTTRICNGERYHVNKIDLTPWLPGVWCRKGEIDIPLYEIQYADKAECDQENGIDNSDEDGTNVGKGIILDSNGNMFIDGKNITEKDLYKTIDKMAMARMPGKKVWKFVYMDTPPPINNAIDKKISDLATRVNSYCTKKSISFSAMGLGIGNSISPGGD